MADVALFCLSTMAVTMLTKSRRWSKSSQSINNSIYQSKTTTRSLERVTANNEPLQSNKKDNDGQDHDWVRATFMFVMHEPPHLFYEPKEWNHTSVLLLKQNKTQQQDGQEEELYTLPGGPVYQGESYEQAAIRRLDETTHIDVYQPENCLHHLFTFPFEYNPDDQKAIIKGVWGDCYECVYRGKLQDLGLEEDMYTTMSLAELKDCLDHDPHGANNHNSTSHPETTEDDRNSPTLFGSISFPDETRHVLKLYFQRQGDLRAKRRLLKGYSSIDLAHYGLRSEKPLMLMSFDDSERNAAVEYTMKTDDGMAPRLLHQADLIILGVSRTGKTPLSILMSQTMGLKVANIPLVLELDPPKALTEDKRIDPKRVFCLTLQPEFLQRMRAIRLRKELRQKYNHAQGRYPRSKYADVDYVQKDLDKAKTLAREHGFTEIDVTGRAMEETASLIVSKLKERFPDMHIN